MGKGATKIKAANAAHYDARATKRAQNIATRNVYRAACGLPLLPAK